MLSVPSVAFEPRFRGSFRNLIYSSRTKGPEKQEMMAYKVSSLKHLINFLTVQNFYNKNIFVRTYSFFAHMHVYFHPAPLCVLS